MAFDSMILPTISVLVLGTTGALTIRSSRGTTARPALRDCGAGVVAGAIGLAMVLSAAAEPASPLRALGNAALMFASGLVWAAAHRLGRGTAPRPTATAAGALVWLGLVLAADPTYGWRIGIGSAILATYGLAAAYELSRVCATDSPAARPVEDELEDALTGVGNPRALTGSGAALIAEALAGGRPLALLMMDLDGFGDVNGRHGPAAADRLLVAFARLAHAYLPPTSLVCRLGGDVFAAVLPDAGPERAGAVADELRSLFAHLKLDGADGPVTATVSIGIAQAWPGRTILADLLDVAEHCLSAAKRAGRDRVVAEAGPFGGTRHCAA